MNSVIKASQQFIEPLDSHLDVLKNVFGHNEFKTKQWEAIRSVNNYKRDCFVNAYAGYGKSLIYQFLPVFLNKIGVIISPLMSLIEDQVFSLKEKNIKVGILNYLDCNENISEFNIVYVTPEYYVANNCQARLEKIKDRLCLIAIDEAHCIVRFGSDYFESYKHLDKLKGSFPEIPIIGLTSTAIPKVQEFIVDLLQMVDPLIITTPLDRTNLRYTKEIMTHPVHDLCPYMMNLEDGSAIIYCINQLSCMEVEMVLISQGYYCKIYTKDTDKEVNKQTIKEFRDNKLKIVVATNAFGMGIDKPDVRVIIHYGFPHSIENFYQESGRAGRDGKQSQCVIFYGNRTLSTYREILKSTKRNMRTHKKEQIINIQEVVLGKECLRMKILRHFDTKLILPNRETCCGICFFHIENSVALNMRYEGLDEQQCYDFSQDARLLLMALRDTRSLSTIDEIINLIVGALPSARERKVFHNAMEYYGVGKSRPIEYWSLLYNELKKIKYCKKKSIDKKGRLFLSLSSNTLKIKLDKIFLKYLTRKPVEYQILPDAKSLITIHHASVNDNLFIPPKFTHKIIHDDLHGFDIDFSFNPSDLRYICEAYIQESDGYDTEEEDLWDDCVYSFGSDGF